MSAPTATAACGVPGASSRTIGSAATATTSATGTSSVSTQVSSADAVAPAEPRSPRPTAPASSGTTRLASAPPATISKMMFGTVLAVWYMSPRSVAPTAVPNTAPRALAPASPSMISSPRSAGRRAAAAPLAPAARSPPVPRVSASGTPVSRPALRARPGRRSSRLTRLALPAMTPAPSTTSTIRPAGRPRPARPESTSAAAARPAAPTPTILTRPLVTRPSRSAARCPRKPLAVFCSGRPPTTSSYPPTRPAPSPATNAAAAGRPPSARPAARAAAADAPTASAGPPARLTVRPRKFVRSRLRVPSSDRRAPVAARAPTTAATSRALRPIAGTVGCQLGHQGARPGADAVVAGLAFQLLGEGQPDHDPALRRRHVVHGGHRLGERRVAPDGAHRVAVAPDAVDPHDDRRHLVELLDEGHHRLVLLGRLPVHVGPAGDDHDRLGRPGHVTGHDQEVAERVRADHRQSHVRADAGRVVEQHRREQCGGGLHAVAVDRQVGHGRRPGAMRHVEQVLVAGRVGELGLHLQPGGHLHPGGLQHVEHRGEGDRPVGGAAQVH